MLQSSTILSQIKEHNVEQKCSVSLLFNALTPISYGQCPGENEKDEKKKKKNQ